MQTTNEPIDYDSPRQIVGYLQSRGLALKKRWGQNFMISRGARERIVELLDPNEEETVWEIGPGLGAMTVQLAPRVKNLILFEIDWGLIRHLEELFAANDHVHIYPGDVLETWREAYRVEGLPAALFGNLPYRSAAILLGSLLENGVVPPRMVFTVQREVAARLGARPGTKDYSGMSVLCQSHCRVEAAGDLKPGAFFPPPEVVSSVVRLMRREDAAGIERPEQLAKLVRVCFAARRKTILNNLSSSPFAQDPGLESVRAALAEHNVPPGERAERLPPETFIALARSLSPSH
jgi:16S rRNA (adenine1518-N6/adenine1519-N6)-dimethyltransferase